MTTEFAGVISILPTPFHDDDTIDLESLDRLVRFSVIAGVDAVSVLGTIDDATRLTENERARVVWTAMSAAGSVPVIVGTTTAIEQAIAASQQALELGASAIAMMPLPSDCTGAEGPLEQVERIAAAAPLPMVLQSAGGRAHLSIDVIVRLLHEVPAIVSVRMQSLPNPQGVAALRRASLGRSVTILSGLGALWGLLDLERGADGFSSGFAFPEVLIAVLHEFRASNRSGTRRILTKYLPLIAFEQQSGIAARKEMLRRRGLLASIGTRGSDDAALDADTSAQLVDLLEAIFPSEDISRVLDISASRPFLVNI